MSIDTTSLNYPFQSNYSSVTPPGFNNMNFTYDNESNTTTTEPTIHPVLQSMPRRTSSSSTNADQPSSPTHSQQQQAMFNLPMYPKEK
jgi:hypothetical protein